MTNDLPPDDSDDREDQPPDHAGDDRFRRQQPGESGGWLSTLITALDRLDRSSRSERTDVDYSVSIRSGLEDLIDGDQPAGRPQTGGPGRRPTSSDRTRSRRVSRQREHVSTRTYDDELLVTVELTGVDPEDVTVGFDDDTLVIGAEGRELERVRVPWSEPNATATIRNDVLTVSVTPDTNE